MSAKSGTRWDRCRSSNNGMTLFTHHNQLCTSKDWRQKKGNIRQEGCEDPAGANEPAPGDVAADGMPV